MVLVGSIGGFIVLYVFVYVLRKICNMSSEDIKLLDSIANDNAAELNGTETAAIKAKKAKAAQVGLADQCSDWTLCLTRLLISRPWKR